MPLIHTPEEAAEIIGGVMKASTLRRLARDGVIASTFIAGKYSFTDAQIAAIVAAGEKPAKAPETGTTAETRPPRRALAPAGITGAVADLTPSPPRSARGQAAYANIADVVRLA